MKIDRKKFLVNSALVAAGFSMAGFYGSVKTVSTNRFKKGPLDYTIVRGHYDIWEFNARLALRQESQNSPLRDHLLPRLLEGGVNVVIMPAGGEAARHRMGSDQLLAGSLRTTDMLIREIEKTNGKASIIKSKKDIPDFPDPNHVKFFLDFEGGNPIEIDAEPGLHPDHRLALLRHLFRVGIRGLQLARDGRNQLADGWLEGKGGKLSRFGVEVVEEMNRLGMMIGVSHISTNGVLHAAEISNKPIVSTHSNPRTFTNTLRDHTDEEIKAIASTGGLVGIRYLGIRTPYSMLVEWIDYMANLVGVEHVGWGVLGHDIGCSGIDHRPNQWFDIELTKYEMMSKFIEELDKRGFSENEIALIMGGNFLRIWKEILPD